MKQVVSNCSAVKISFLKVMEDIKSHKIKEIWRFLYKAARKRLVLSSLRKESKRRKKEHHQQQARYQDLLVHWQKS